METKKYSELTQEERANFLELEDIVVEVDVANLSVEEVSNVINYAGNLIAEKEQRIMELERSAEGFTQIERGNILLEERIGTLESVLKQKDVEIGRLSKLLPKSDLAEYLEKNKTKQDRMKNFPVLNSAIQITLAESLEPTFTHKLVDEFYRSEEWKIYSNSKELGNTYSPLGTDSHFYFLNIPNAPGVSVTGYFCNANKEDLLNPSTCWIFKFEIASC